METWNVAVLMLPGGEAIGDDINLLVHMVHARHMVINHH
jgi:hypothetical protein